MKKVLLTILFFSQVAAYAGDFDSEMDALGGNKDLIKRARSLDPDNRMKVVQKRAVDRNFRLELGVMGGMVAGGDPYTSTQNLGGNLDFHINPRWSVGARYFHSFNRFNSEGERVMKEAQAANATGGDSRYPALDYSKETYIGVINFYPVYGKMNFFDMGIAQFDVYMLGGYGMVQLASGGTNTFTAGGGFGLWLNNHVSSRLEVRYQSYKDQIYSGPRQIDITVITAGMGFLL